MPDTQEVSREWIVGMFRASRLLAVGSGLLFVAALALFSEDPYMTFVGLFAYPLLAGIGVALHAIAWMKLNVLSRASRGLRWAFRTSILGFLAGLVAWPFVVPTFGGRVLLSLVCLLIPTLPLYPSTFAPVVVPHAAVYLIAWRSLRSVVSRRFIVAGSTYLIVDAILAVFVQASGGFGAPLLMFFFSGATSIGYALIGFAWWRESEHVLIASGTAGTRHESAQTEDARRLSGG